MKFLKYAVVAAAFSVISCGKSEGNRWDVAVNQTAEPLHLTDISEKFYDLNFPFSQFKAEFPWFQGTVPDEEYAQRRQDSAEVRIYREALVKLDKSRIQKDLQNLFSHVKYYFPKFESPKVFLYSSALLGATDPVFYKADGNMLFIDITGFLGENHSLYKSIPLYFQKSMTPQNLVPKVAEILANELVMDGSGRTKFTDKMVREGKILILQDAFLPNTSDHLKIGYTQPQYQWAKDNEENIWNYFVENNLLFSDNEGLGDRFLAPGPFSKFYTEIDNQSSPRIGAFTGWQICRSYFKKNPETKLTDFLKMDAIEIFNGSAYKGK